MARFASKQQKLIVAVRQNFKCNICGCELGKTFEADHITPFCLGGRTELNNLQGVCKPCHNLKTKKDGSVLKISS
jgi:5-methylcytosine-specific restriction protein A